VQKSASTLRTLLTSVAIGLAVLAGCSTLDVKQREWIFQPSDSAWGGVQTAPDMQDVWIDFQSDATSGPARLHALWLPASTSAPKLTRKEDAEAHPAEGPPVLLYLHGARWNVIGAAPRIRRMRDLGFSVLAIDYRGFGKSSTGLPTEATATEDARIAWDWIARHFPERQRYVFGHSLGGAVAIEMASQVSDASGVIVESTFSTIADVVSNFKWGWLPVGPLITQRFESVDRVRQLHAPLLVVHGSDDSLIPAALGRKLYEAARVKKEFILVQGGSHYSTNALGEDQYRVALRSLFGLKVPGPDVASGAPNDATRAVSATALPVRAL
jgi:pimeloyl-ACP methyl ester carboxylesterase